VSVRLGQWTTFLLPPRLRLSYAHISIAESSPD
jgi:hypothetical protein